MPPPPPRRVPRAWPWRHREREWLEAVLEAAQAAETAVKKAEHHLNTLLPEAQAAEKSALKNKKAEHHLNTLLPETQGWWAE